MSLNSTTHQYSILYREERPRINIVIPKIILRYIRLGDKTCHWPLRPVVFQPGFLSTLHPTQALRLKEVYDKENILFNMACHMTSQAGGSALISRSCISAAVYGMRMRRHAKGIAIELYSLQTSCVRNKNFTFFLWSVLYSFQSSSFKINFLEQLVHKVTRILALHCLPWNASYKEISAIFIIFRVARQK